MALKYTTVQGFWKFMGINNSTADYNPDNVTSGVVSVTETVKTTPVAATTYYLKQKGINPDTLIVTGLTLTTDYTFDSDTSGLTIKSSGVVKLSGVDLIVSYEHCDLGKDLNYNETLKLLEQSEDKLEDGTNCVFANQSDTAPNYEQIVSESMFGQGTNNVNYQTRVYPVVKLQTTTNGAYTTGGTEITLTSATGFPSSGTIYIGGNKVSYSAKASNVLTIPSSTPSIDASSVVRGEVVEVSTSPSGVDPTFVVLTPDSDYAIDYDTGLIQMMDEYYFATDTNLTHPGDGIMDRVRVTYNHAWHELGQPATVPAEIEQIVYMIAGRQVIQRTVLKSLAGQRDNFTAQSFGFSKLDIEEALQEYRCIRNSNV
jgi:hypothetical protein